MICISDIKIPTMEIKDFINCVILILLKYEKAFFSAFRILVYFPF